MSSTAPTMTATGVITISRQWRRTECEQRGAAMETTAEDATDTMDHVMSRALSAYTTCLCLEAKLQSTGTIAKAQKDVKELEKSLIYCRILGYLLLYAPTEQALWQVHEEILSCSDDDAKLQLGKMYYNHYIRAFRANKERTPAPSSHASRPSFDRASDKLKWTLENAPESRGKARILVCDISFSIPLCSSSPVTKALYRDGYRCVMSGRYDARSAKEDEELGNLAAAALVAPTKCANIIPEDANKATATWNVMKNFGYSTILEELNGDKVHRLENVMTLREELHTYFHASDIWLSATEIPNRYKLEATKPFFISELPQFITFTTPDPEDFPLPSPAYLALHASCARIAHLSGAAEYIEKTLRDLEETGVLKEDGTSENLLEHACSSTTDERIQEL